MWRHTLSTATWPYPRELSFAVPCPWPILSVTFIFDAQGLLLPVNQIIANVKRLLSLMNLPKCNCNEFRRYVNYNELTIQYSVILDWISAMRHSTLSYISKKTLVGDTPLFIAVGVSSESDSERCFILILRHAIFMIHIIMRILRKFDTFAIVWITLCVLHTECVIGLLGKRVLMRNM